MRVLLTSLKKTNYAYGYKTDHSLFEMNIKINEVPRGRGYWKFNSNLLHDKEYVNKVNDIIVQIPLKYRFATPR